MKPSIPSNTDSETRRAAGPSGLARSIGPLAVCFALQAALVPGPGLAAESPEVPDGWEWSGVSRVVAIGDVHGDMRKLTRLLVGADLVDESLHWTGGRNHLVVTGDFLDRGKDDRAVMDLLRQLQRESAADGGRVHVLLGNHEVMNLFRDNRYVSPASYRDFADEEQRSERRAALAQLAVGLGGGRRLEAMQEFNRKFPPGYFARQASFGADGEYGSWLLGLPTIVKVNEVAYLHGGLTEEFAALKVDGINRRVAEVLRQNLEARELLEAEGVFLPAMDFGELLGVAREALARWGERRKPRLREAAQGFLESGQSPILGAGGPLWYRGNSYEDERIERASVERSLELVGAKALVIAHSPTPGTRITSRFHGQLFRIDHGYEEGDGLHSLVAAKGELMVLNAATRETTEPFRELPPGRYASGQEIELSDYDLQEFLAESTIVASRDLGRGSTRPQLLVLERDGQTRRGIFKSVETDGDRPDRYQHEVAAYRLDRQLGLQLVPVTVLRKIDGQLGSLQSWVEGAVDRETADAYEFELYKAASVVGQLEQGEVFDALIGNPDRTGSDVLRLLNREKVFLIDHSRAFSASTELYWDAGRNHSISPGLAAALRSLDRGALATDLGKLLGARQIEALLARRDRILELVEIADSEPSAP